MASCHLAHRVAYRARNHAVGQVTAAMALGAMAINCATIHLTAKVSAPQGGLQAHFSIECPNC